MSLFSGIKFTSDKSKALAAESEATAAAAGGSVRASTSIKAKEEVSATPKTLSEPKPASDQSAGPSKQSSEALLFAPRAPRANKPKAKPVTAFSTPAVSSSAVVEAAPVLIVPPKATASSALPKADQVVIGDDGVAIVRAPAMTLAAEKKNAAKKNEQQRKKKKKRRRMQPVYHTFIPDEDYDPNYPNDLGEYQHYRQKLRDEGQAQFMEQRRRRAAGEASDASSYYSDSSDDAPRRDAPKLFAPPKNLYSPPQAKASLPTPQRHSLPPPPPMRPPLATGDDAYARRVAMSASTGDEAYARRLAMSQAATGDDAYARRAALSTPIGEDAYARRATLSRPEAVQTAPPPMPAPPSGPPAFRPPPAHLLSGAPPPFRPPPSHLMSSAPLPPGVHGSMPPRPPSGYPPARPPPPDAAAPPPTAPPPVDPEYQRQLEEKMRAAEAVAAKFRALTGAPEPTTAPVDDDQSGTFAERMMRKWGHSEGKGLGKREDGIQHALTAEHVLPQVDTSKMSKRAAAKQRAAAANAKNRKWAQAPITRGRIVNANQDMRSKEDQERYGELSRVVCLTGLVDNPEDLGDDLSDQIGEECSQHGIVERVVLHFVEPPPADPADGLRVFVVFSGVAGAFRATRELDKRMFNEKRMRARYYNEELFNSGERDASF